GERPAGRDDVLHEAHQLARAAEPFKPVRGAIFLRLTAHDDEGPSGRHGCRSCQRDGSERGPRKPDGIWLNVLHDGGEALSELPQQFRLRLEAVLVEVVARALAGAEHEIAFEQRVLDEQLTERVDGGGRAHGASASCAAATSASCSNEAGATV